MPVAELDIRNAIVALIQGVTGAGNVFNRLRIPADALLSELQILTVDDLNRINVVFVRWVALTPEVSSFDDPIAASESYEIWFYRGIVDATDGTDSENELVAFIHAVQAELQLFTNRHLILTTPGFVVSQGGMTTASPLINTEELGGAACHRFIGRLTVTIGDC